MRFWDVQDGSVSVDGTDVRKIPTKHLRDMESYVTQETHLFHDSIANNIADRKAGSIQRRDYGSCKESVYPRFHNDTYRKDMIQKSENWVIRCPVVKNRESELQEHFSMNAL